MVNQYCICYSCGMERVFSPNELACDILDGWFIVSRFTGKSSVAKYNFCSYYCLQEWIISQSSCVPEIFIKSINEETGSNN
ncbi:MAG: hypothetical protein PHE15_04470 [Dehalococcoidales bacterium]|nr:hypothetical protein [Dehalococcoidales bacterium]